MNLSVYSIVSLFAAKTMRRWYKACSLLTRSQLTNYCVMPPVVSDQSDMSDILKSSNHYIDGLATYSVRQSRTPTGSDVQHAVTHILLLLLPILQKRCRWYKGLQPYYALPTS